MVKGFGGLNLDKLMKQAQEMQKQMSEIQNSLKDRVVEGSAGGGMVKAQVNGQQEVVNVKIEKEVVDPEDLGMLEDLIIAAVNEGLRKSRELAQQEMAKATGGLVPPGILPGM